MSVRNEGLAFCGESVFLEAAVGFMRDGAFDEAGFNSWEQVGFPEALTICKIESYLKLFSGVFRHDSLKKISDLRGDLRGNLRLCEKGRSCG